jgi:hypothetical protein
MRHPTAQFGEGAFQRFKMDRQRLAVGLDLALRPIAEFRPIQLAQHRSAEQAVEQPLQRSLQRFPPPKTDRRPPRPL